MKNEDRDRPTDSLLDRRQILTAGVSENAASLARTQA
jgi:hypothetical protein